MAITQLNSYLPGQNLTNLAENVDYNRVGDDKTDITINHTTTPWTFTIKVGSIIEKDGNAYTVDTADYTLQATSNTHNYIVFTGTAFASSANRGTYDPAKGGFYDSGNRVLKYFIDPDNDVEYTLVANGSRTEDLIIQKAYFNNDITLTGDIEGGVNTYDFDPASTTSLITKSFGPGSSTQYIYIDLFKPSIWGYNTSITNGGTTGTTTMTMTTEISINGSWITTGDFFTLTRSSSSSGTSNQTVYSSYHASKYRLKIVYTAGGGGNAGSLGIFLASCYGYNNITAADGIVYTVS